MPRSVSTSPARTSWPRCIHLAGADGSGKTTQARALMRRIEDSGVKVRHVWLRHPRLFSVPFLAYARLRGHSVREIVNGTEHGYWDFRSSWLLRTVFPWVLLLDTAILAIVRVTVPLRGGGTIVCDRFVIDTLVDLMVGLGNPRFDVRAPGSWFLALLPDDSGVVVMDLETELARRRSPELLGDRTHAVRRRTYLELASRHGWTVVSTHVPVELVTEELVSVLTNQPTRLDDRDGARGSPEVAG